MARQIAFDKKKNCLALGATGSLQYLVDDRPSFTTETVLKKIFFGAYA
jgi:hypothetical protein